MEKYRKNSGFTLVELIIVIIIIGILATLAIPQFFASTQDARESTLVGDLAVMRNAIQLYYHQHNGTFPGAVKTDGSGDATGDSGNPAAFIDQLTKYTAADGETSDNYNRTNYPYGPYLATGVPANPLPVAGADADSVTVTTDVGTLTADGNPTTGWKYSKVTGRFIANNDDYDDL